MNSDKNLIISSIPVIGITNRRPPRTQPPNALRRVLTSPNRCQCLFLVVHPRNKYTMSTNIQYSFDENRIISSRTDDRSTISTIHGLTHPMHRLQADGGVLTIQQKPVKPQPAQYLGHVRMPQPYEASYNLFAFQQFLLEKVLHNITGK